MSTYRNTGTATLYFKGAVIAPGGTLRLDDEVIDDQALASVQRHLQSGILITVADAEKPEMKAPKAGRK